MNTVGVIILSTLSTVLTLPNDYRYCLYMYRADRLQYWGIYTNSSVCTGNTHPPVSNNSLYSLNVSTQSSPDITFWVESVRTGQTVIDKRTVTSQWVSADTDRAGSECAVSVQSSLPSAVIFRLLPVQSIDPNSTYTAEYHNTSTQSTLYLTVRVEMGSVQIVQGQNNPSIILWLYSLYLSLIFILTLCVPSPAPAALCLFYVYVLTSVCHNNIVLADTGDLIMLTLGIQSTGMLVFYLFHRYPRGSSYISLGVYLTLLLYLYPGYRISHLYPYILLGVITGAGGIYWMGVKALSLGSFLSLAYASIYFLYVDSPSTPSARLARGIDYSQYNDHLPEGAYTDRVLIILGIILPLGVIVFMRIVHDRQLRARIDEREDKDEGYTPPNRYVPIFNEYTHIR